MADPQTYEQAARARGLDIDTAHALRRARGLSAASLEEIPERKLRRAIRKLDHPDLPLARLEFRRRQALDDTGELPGDALPDAFEQLTSTRDATAAQVAGVPTGPDGTSGVAAPPSAGLGPGAGTWRAIGPGNIGGRTRAIVVHPSIAGRIWAGSAGGGVWRTDDGGKSWDPVDDFMSNLAVSAMVMDPTNPSTIYAATGEGFANVDALRGAGLFRTTDGVNWQRVASTTGPEFRMVNRLALSRDGKTLLVATPAGMFRSTDVHRATWTRVLAGTIADVKFHPTDNTKAIAGDLTLGEAYVSTDGGRTWTRAQHDAPWQRRVELTYAAKNPSIVYASIQMASGQIWRSVDGGKTYTRRKALVDGRASAYLGAQGWYDNVIWAGDPTNENLVIVGGIDLWRSTDGGDTLRDISSWWDTRSAHADQHCIVSDPKFNGTTNKRVYFGNDGGIFRTDDVRTVGNDPTTPRIKGWIELRNELGTTQFYGGAGNPATGVIIGGAQDNGTLMYTPAGGSERWTEMSGGDGGWCAADPTDPKVLYGEYVDLNIHRSLDGGRTAEYISGKHWTGQKWIWKAAPYRIEDAMTGAALFIAPFALDPNAPNRLLGGGRSLWRTNDAKRANTPTTGPSWQAVKPDIGPAISAIAVARGRSDLVWVGHEDGQLFKTTNGTSPTPAWHRVDDVNPSPVTAKRYCTGITIDARAPDTVYATFGGYLRDNLWKTTDGGATWRDIGQSLPEAPVRALTLHPDNSAFAYAGTEVGLFASEDGGATWSPTNEGPTNCSVDDLFWMNRVLVCVTHGRGMFQIDLTGAG